MIFFFNDTATTEIYTLSLHDALPICPDGELDGSGHEGASRRDRGRSAAVRRSCPRGRPPTTRSWRAVRHSASGALRCRYGAHSPVPEATARPEECHEDGPHRRIPGTP